uniref:Ig-like domain-containing protein n=1 Tax=Callorhinchus milii TaxID=7868 RepID=A0A4W3IXU8_CALMI
MPLNLLFVAIGCDAFTLSQPLSMIVKSGKVATITCKKNNIDNDNVHWYRESPGKGLQWILYYHSRNKKDNSPDFLSRFSSDKSGDSCTLTIIRLTSDDSATYYCGLWHSHRPPRHTRHRTKSCLSQDHLGCSWDCVLKGRLLTAAEKTI